MKKILSSFLALLTTLSVYAQAGLTQGEAVVNPSSNPQQTQKHCPHCGITMGNITYPWQHEIGCPYYRSQTPALYDDVTFTKDGYVFQQNGLYGFASPQGKTVLEPEFQSIQMVDHDPELVKFTKINDAYVGKKMFFVKKDGKWGVKHWADGSYILEPLILDRSKVLYYLGTLKTFDYKMMERDQRAHYSSSKELLQTATFFIYQHFAQIAQMDIKLPSGKVYHYVNPGLEGYTGPIVNYSDLY